MFRLFVFVSFSAFSSVRLKFKFFYSSESFARKEENFLKRTNTNAYSTLIVFKSRFSLCLSLSLSSSSVVCCFSEFCRSFFKRAAARRRRAACCALY